MSTYDRFSQHDVRRNRSVTLEKDFNLSVEVSIPLSLDMDSLEQDAGEEGSASVNEAKLRTLDEAEEAVRQAVSKGINYRYELENIQDAGEVLIESLGVSLDEGGEDESLTVNVSGSHEIAFSLYAQGEVLEAGERGLVGEAVDEKAVNFAGALSHSISMELMDIVLVNLKAGKEPVVNVKLSPTA